MFCIIWSALPDEGESVVGPFPTIEDAESWATKYLGSSEVCWNVKRLTAPAQYPAVTVGKRSEYEISVPSGWESV